MKFSFIAKHRGIWAVDWMCGALGVSRGGFYAWLTRPRSQRSRDNEELAAKVRLSFLASDRTYGARRVWRDLLAEGISCGLHRIERLMRLQALKARPRRRRLPPDLGERQVGAVAPNVRDCQDFCVRPVIRHAFTKRSLNMTANWVFASAHSRGGRFHSAAAWFKTRYSSLVAVSSDGKCPLVRTARRSFEFSASIALVV